MEDVVCLNCGLVNEFRTEMRNGQKCAWCTGCDKYIKNIAHSKARFYFGKYKGIEIAKCADLSYLEWFLNETAPKANIKKAVIEQIDILQKGGQDGLFNI
jgi:uncharacterized protein (DUF3820 family)